MSGVAVWLVAAAVGGTVGWWLGREVNRGMPFLWPDVFTRVTAAATVGFTAGFVTMAAVTVEEDLAERGSGPPPDTDTGPDAGPDADPHPDPDMGSR